MTDAPSRRSAVRSRRSSAQRGARRLQSLPEFAGQTSTGRPSILALEAFGQPCRATLSPRQRYWSKYQHSLRVVPGPDPVHSSPFKPWQWAELSALVLVVVVQLWLYKISVVAAAAWGLLVPALLIHVYFWMAPLLREQGRHGQSGEQD